MSRSSTRSSVNTDSRRNKRQSAVERIAVAQLAAMGGTLADTIGDNNRQRLIWLGLLASPLLFPVALPGMATGVGALCVVVALRLGSGAEPGAWPRPRFAQRAPSARQVRFFKPFLPIPSADWR